MPRLALVGWLGLLTANGHAHVTTQSSIERYAVRVQAPQTLQQALNATSPIRENGRVYYGHTQWWVSWTFHWHQQPSGRCAITNVSVEVKTRMQLPELLAAPAADRARFERFLPRLRLHEEGHRDHGLAAAAEVDRRLATLPEMASCAQLEATANAAGQSVIDGYAARDRQYDAATEHGKTQGAWLTP
jgi:predicted secreted Zn-dependent protease